MREILFRGKRADSGEWVYGIPARFRNIDNVVRSCIIQEMDGEHIMSGTVGVNKFVSFNPKPRTNFQL